jgi:hypothetical protein
MTDDQIERSVDPDIAAKFNTNVPHSARVWNYWLGGKDHFGADRATGDAVLSQHPWIRDIALESRAFLRRAVTFLAADAGIRQFLDIGTGLPTAENTHQVAQRAAPASRIVYVDNDPLVLAHARALLTSTPEGRTAYIDEDLRDPEKILSAAAETLDFTKPIAVLLLGILAYLPDYEQAHAIVRTLMEGVPSGSYLVINDGTTVDPDAIPANRAAQNAGLPYHLRTLEEFTGYFDGLELVEPGIITSPRWRPGPEDEPRDMAVFCGVARKP